MQILVNPRQTNKIILESSFKDMSNGIKKSYELVKDVLTKTGEQINMNLSFLFTWGASIGGMVGPLNDFIQNKHPELQTFVCDVTKGSFPLFKSCSVILNV